MGKAELFFELLRRRVMLFDERTNLSITSLLLNTGIVLSVHSDCITRYLVHHVQRFNRPTLVTLLLNEVDEPLLIRATSFT